MATKAKCEAESLRSKNQEKRLAKLRKTYADISNLYKSHYHKVSRMIADQGYGTVVLEDLKVSKIEHSEPYMRKYVKPARLATLIDYISYKCKDSGSRVIKAPTTFPSSQICSFCGARRSKFAQKRFVCTTCGFTTDRDYNASVNLMQYGINVLMDERNN